MLGSEVPDLGVVPCAGCGALVAAGGPVVWDAWHTGPVRYAALPYHEGCAAPVLPPVEPTDSMRTCAICRAALDANVLSDAMAALAARFRSPLAPKGPPAVVWRLVSRAPRAFVAEHLACLLARVTGGRAGPP